MIKCFIDLDGVLVDFYTGLMKHLGINLDVHKDLPKPINHNWCYDFPGYGKNELFRTITPDFWLNLEWTKEGPEILEAAIRSFGKDNVCILTHPSEHAPTVMGKMMWMEKHLGGFPYLLGGHKFFCANKRSVLIDDCDDHIRAFRLHLGRGVLVPRMWNSLHDREVFPHVAQQLAYAKYDSLLYGR